MNTPLESLVFDEWCGDFHFQSGRVGYDLWEDVRTPSTDERSFLVESGDRVVFNSTTKVPIHDDPVYFEGIEHLMHELNALVERKIAQRRTHEHQGWPADIEAMGKMLFWSEDDHSTVVLLWWARGRFHAAAHKYE